MSLGESVTYDLRTYPSCCARDGRTPIAVADSFNRTPLATAGLTRTSNSLDLFRQMIRILVLANKIVSL